MKTITFEAPESITRRQVIEAIRILGFDPDTVKRIDIEPHSIQADLQAVDAEGERVWAGARPVVHSVVIDVLGTP